ncbi:phosphoribosylglycinamide formyltransferase, partial [Pseudomonas ogarae]
QAVIPVELHDAPQSLAQRVHAREHQIYPMAVRWFAEGRLTLDDRGASLDGQLLAASGHLIRY